MKVKFFYLLSTLFFILVLIVSFKTVGNSKTTLMYFLPSAINLELAETGIREIIGRIYYIIKGKINP